MESEKLYQELEELRATLPEIEREENEAIEDPGLRELITRLSTATVVFEVNDLRVSALQREVAARVATIRSRRREYLKRLGRISKELSALTAPVIRNYAEELSNLAGRPKLNREILSKEYHGFSKTTILSITSNENSIRKIKSLVKKAIEKIQGMAMSPISEIRNAFIEEKLTIEGTDWRTVETLKMDEREYFRGSPPLGICPTYEGPLSGTPMGPPVVVTQK